MNDPTDPSHGSAGDEKVEVNQKILTKKDKRTMKRPQKHKEEAEEKKTSGVKRHITRIESLGRALDIEGLCKRIIKLAL
ncbi:uncharacterized protein VTP21DRAFT_6185 [Calcarisporiella thermophila]|uniref:uncharacterized protein n=1 Tax=Calcarisporiella thermophila TaxID=911321 RepID=UPI003744860F